MTVPVKSDAARFRDEPAEGAQHDGSHRSRRTTPTERDLAELEARLELEACFDLAGLKARPKHDLQHSPSPSIAAPNGEVEWPCYDTGSLLRQTPRARLHPATGEADAPRFLRQATRREAPLDKRLEQLLIELKQLSAPSKREDAGPQSTAEAALNRGIARRTASVRPPMRGNEPIGSTEVEFSPMRARAPADAHDLGDREFVESRVPEPELAPWLDRPDDRAPLAALPRPDQPSLFTRVTRAVAAVFSVVTLVGVSGLTVVLVAGGEPPATVTAEDAALAEQSAVAAWSASMPLVPSERVDAPPEISAIGGKQDMSRVSSEATAPARGGGTTRPIDTQTAGRFANTAQPAKSWGVQSVPTASAPAQTSAPSTEKPAAQTETTVVETDDKRVETAGVLVREAARSTRSVAMTMHVNLRSGPNNDAAVVAVVPAGRNVEVVDCTQWCEVVYDGRQGFIYRKFVSGAEQ